MHGREENLILIRIRIQPRFTSIRRYFSTAPWRGYFNFWRARCRIRDQRFGTVAVVDVEINNRNFLYAFVSVHASRVSCRDGNVID